MLALTALLVLSPLGVRMCAGSVAGPVGRDERLLFEQKHFLSYLAYAYNPALWISFRDALYFIPKTEAQWRQVEALKAERAQYVVFTNRQARHELAAKVLAESGLEPNWQARLLLPYSPTNQDLIPSTKRPLSILDRYRVLQSFPDEPGDVVIESHGAIGYVMGFGRGTADAGRTNAVLIREGMKTYTTETKERRTVDAYTNVALTRAEIAVLNRAATAFQQKAQTLTLPASVVQRQAPPPVWQPGGSDARQQFENYKARATEASPHIEFQLALAYLEGRGTAQNEKLGLQWMQKAAEDGSGDATAYLEKLKPKAK